MTTEQRATLKALLQYLTSKHLNTSAEFRAVQDLFEIATCVEFDMGRENFTPPLKKPFALDVYVPGVEQAPRHFFETTEARAEFAASIVAYGDEVSEAEFTCDQPGRDCNVLLNGREIGSIYCYSGRDKDVSYCVRLYRRQLGSYATPTLARRAVHDFLLSRGNTEQVLAYRLYDTDIILLDDGHDFHIDSIARINGKIRVTNKAGDYREFASNELLTCRAQ